MEIPSKWTCRIQQIRTSEVPWNRARLAKPLVLDSGDDTSGLSVVQSSYKRWLSNETPMALIHISGKTSHGSMCYHMGSTHGKLPNKFHISMVFFSQISMENEPFLHDFPMISMAEEGWRRSMGLRQHGEAQQWRHHETTMKSHYLPSIYHRKWGWHVFFHSIQCHENIITVSFAIKVPFKHHILRWGTSPEDIPFLDDEAVKHPLDSAFWSTKILGQRSWRWSFAAFEDLQLGLSHLGDGFSDVPNETYRKMAREFPSDRQQLSTEPGI